VSVIFHVQDVKRSRKRRRCCWCGESVEVGHPYMSYRYREGRDHGTVTLHPECRAAQREVAEIENEEFTWSVGDFARGTCNERM
jgi:hypothetical protein